MKNLKQDFHKEKCLIFCDLLEIYNIHILHPNDKQKIFRSKFFVDENPALNL